MRLCASALPARHEVERISGLRRAAEGVNYLKMKGFEALQV